MARLKQTHIVALATFLVLAGCADANDEGADANGDGRISDLEVAAALSKLESQFPVEGRWTLSIDGSMGSYEHEGCVSDARREIVEDLIFLEQYERLKDMPNASCTI